MSYKVLARKYRPKSFSEVKGQSYVTDTLINALTQGRLHQAYLFTGAQGVGKTTLARILGKCLTCETGVTANPCNKCSICNQIDSGSFIDLIEVDGASRTKIEDIRELLSNVQYVPTIARYKIYLIDEVHMLSKHSFNALLKTLEEPPPYVKFLLATTDPEKIPVTVLSRCLQFHLRPISSHVIEENLIDILKKEDVVYEEKAIQKLANATSGSMRDSLSLLDQAIAYTNCNITVESVDNMLNTTKKAYIFELLKSLKDKEATRMLEIIKDISEQGVDFDVILKELLSLLHKISVVQIVQNSRNQDTQIVQFAKQFMPEDIQLFYQIALIGRRDLPFAASPKDGFEMVMLRMFAFNPLVSSLDGESDSGMAEKKQAEQKDIFSIDKDWHKILPKLDITGSTKALAMHCYVNFISNEKVQLFLDKKYSAMLDEDQKIRLSKAFSKFFEKPVKVEIDITEELKETPRSIKSLKEEKEREKNERIIQNDENIRAIMSNFDAEIVPNSTESTED